MNARTLLAAALVLALPAVALAHHGWAGLARKKRSPC